MTAQTSRAAKRSGNQSQAPFVLATPPRGRCIPANRRKVAEFLTIGARDNFCATRGGTPLLHGMKQIKTKQPARSKLVLAKETIRSLKVLSRDHLADVQGGLMDLHTSFSCGNDLCTTH